MKNAAKQIFEALTARHTFMHGSGPSESESTILAHAAAYNPHVSIIPDLCVEQELLEKAIRAFPEC